MSEKKITGPIQAFVIGFDDLDATGQVLEELKRVRKRGVIRLVDLLFVQKDTLGEISSAMHLTDFSEAERQHLGSVIGGLIGLEAGGAAGAVVGAEAVAERDYGMNLDELLDLADSIPNDSAAAIMIVEHHWATRLRGALAEAGGLLLMQAMITPDALALVGAEMEAAIEAEEAIEDAAQAQEEAEAAVMLADLIVAEAVERAVNALIAADMVEAAAAEEAAAVVATAMMIEVEAMAEAEDTVEAAEEFEDEVY